MMSEGGINDVEVCFAYVVAVLEMSSDSAAIF